VNKVKTVLRIADEVPLVGAIPFGLIDRGTNVIQVRPVGTCNLSCIFCSTDAGPSSMNRQAEYYIDLDYLLEWFAWISEFKGDVKIEAHIDTVGDPLTYNRLVDLVQGLKTFKNVQVVSLQTHGFLLSEERVEELEEAGLDRINLSIDSLEDDKAKMLAGSRVYDVSRIVEIAKYIIDNTAIDLLISPIWIPSLNDIDIEQIIDFAKEIKAGKKWPPLGIQKYEVHRFGRKPKGIKPMKWYEFYQALRRLEKKHGVKLVLSPRDFNIVPAKPLPKPYKLGERVSVEVIGPGWFRGEYLALTRNKDRVVMVVGAEVPIGSEVKVTIVRNKDNIYVGRID